MTLLACRLAFSLAVALADNNESIVTLTFGQVSGNVFEKHREFLGVPFATPPTRFEKPQPWSAMYEGGILYANSFVSRCMQNDCDDDTKVKCSEDCLQLNVYTPLDITEPLPVMLWIHGGALQSGSAVIYPAANLAIHQRVVVVTVNYRLNAFGFMPIPRPDGSMLANNGLRDQREAMHFVRNTIAAFGGNPRSVTLFGESAGGQSITAHMASPGSAGLFDAVISESGDATLVDTVVRQAPIWNATLQHFDCAGAVDESACMHAVDAFELATYYQSISATPLVVDNDILPDFPLTRIEEGHFHRVPVLLGSNALEGSLFLYADRERPATSDDIKCALRTTFGEKIGGQLADVIYTPTFHEGVDNRAVLAQAITDVFYACVDRALARSYATHNNAPWLYVFERHPTCSVVPGAYHSSEVSFVFDDVEGAAELQGCAAPEQEIALGHRMAQLWADFAKHHRAERAWKRFSLKDELSLHLDISSPDRLDMQSGYRRSACDIVWPVVEAAPSISDLAVIFGSLQICQNTTSSALMV